MIVQSPHGSRCGSEPCQSPRPPHIPSCKPVHNAAESHIPPAAANQLPAAQSSPHKPPVGREECANNTTGKPTDERAPCVESQPQTQAPASPPRPESKTAAASAAKASS